MKEIFKDFFFSQLKYGYLFKKRIKFIKDLNNYSTNNLKLLENELLVSHIKNAYYKSSFYKELYDSYGVNMNQIQTNEDIKELPIITKQLIKDKVDDIYVGNRLLKHSAFTSGTTGTPLKIYYSLNCVINEACYNEVFRNNAGHYFGDKVLSLRGSLEGNKMEHFDKFNNVLYLSSYHIKRENAKWYYDKIKCFNPKTILAYPSSLEALSNILNENKLEINIPITFTSSESLYPHQQEKIEKTLKTKIFDRYGNAERTISLIQNLNKGEYHFPRLYSFNEFINKDKVITTNLINKEFPLIRYEVNDLFDYKNGVVTKIGGRIDDSIITEDGRIIGSAAMSLAFKKAPNVLMAQILQPSKRKIIVNVVGNEYFSDQNSLFLKKEIKQRIGDNMDVCIRSVTESKIIKTKKNKYKLIISKLDFDR